MLSVACIAAVSIAAMIAALVWIYIMITNVVCSILVL